MAFAPIMFDYEAHGEQQLASAIRRLPPGGCLILARSGVKVQATEGGARRFVLNLPPKMQTRPELDRNGLTAASTAPSVVIQAHRAVLAEQPDLDQEVETWL